MEKTKKRDTEKAARILKTARIAGVTPRSVERVLNQEQQNQKVMTIYMELLEGENVLVQAVKELVPFI